MDSLTIKVLAVVIVVSVLTGNVDGAKCERLSSCSCECPDGIIDLKPLTGSDGNPKYKDQPAQDQYMYSYNPCKGFTETSPGSVQSNCNDVAACQVISINSIFQYYDIGTQSSASFETRAARDVGVQEDGEVVVAMYKAGDGGRQSEVVLVCNDDNGDTQMAVIGELPQQGTPTYRFIIVSPDACFIPAGGLSAGSIMLIVFFSGLAAYLIFGILYQKVIAKANGRELLPNSGLWFSFPGYVKDGTCFLMGRCRPGYKPV